jgi:hypothetical protein
MSLTQSQPFRVFAAVTAAAISAAVVALPPALAPSKAAFKAASNSAGAAMMQLLRDEHALAAAQLRAGAQAMQADNREADVNLAEMKQLAARESAQRIAEQRAVAAPSMRLTMATVPTPPRHQAIAQPPSREAPPDRAPDPALQEPLPLASANPPAMAERGLRARMRAMMAGVIRLPAWVGQAAGDAAHHAAAWVVELPGRAVIDRRFLSVSL